MRKVAVLLLPLATVLANSPLLEPNRGQFSAGVQFLSKIGAVSMAITNSGIAFRGNGERMAFLMDRAQLNRCDPASAEQSEANYLARTPLISSVPRYTSVVCREIYPGVDWVVRSSAGSIEDDWKLAPGAESRLITLILEGNESAQVTPQGRLLLRSGGLTINWKKPQSYQDVDGKRRRVETRYFVHGRRISFKIGRHRHDLPLVIDPVIDFSYVVNGNEQDFGCQPGFDGAGNLYLAGLTASSDFETSAGAAFGAPTASLTGSSLQVFVRELSPDGSKEIYSTYLGLAVNQSSHPVGMRVDAAGNVYLAVNAFASNVAGGGTPIDPSGIAALYKLAPGGAHLIYGTRLLPGFEYTEPVGLAVDGAGNAYVGIGSTTIAVSKVDPTGQKQLYLYRSVVSNYFGGLADVAVGTDGSVYLAGTSGMGGLMTTPGALNIAPVNPQNSHGYLIRLRPDGSAPIYSTYIAGDYVDSVSALAIDSSGAAYVGGQTSGNVSFSAIPGTSLGLTQPQSTTAFVMKVDLSGATALHTSLLPYSAVTALALDAAGNLYTVGSLAFGGIATAKIDPTGKQLLYYLSIPGPAQPAASGIVVDSSGAAFIAGTIASDQIPAAIQYTRLQPNAFLLKVDASPDQCDIRVQAQTVGPVLPNEPVTQAFTISNNGPAAAQNVIFSATLVSDGLQVISCRTSGTSACGTNPEAPWASFPSIPAGGSATVELTFQQVNVTMTASVSTVTSDVNQDNNSASVTIDIPGVPLTVRSDPQASYVLTPAVGPQAQYRSDVLGVGPYVAPNTPFQIFWPSPQTVLSAFGATFQSWEDGSTDNPRTFTSTTIPWATFTLIDTPYFTPASLVSSASYVGNGVSPGELVSFFGFNLGDIASAQVTSGRFPTTLGDVTVNFDGTPAPLIYSSSNVLNAIVPYEIAGQSSTNISVKFSSLAAFSTTVPVVRAVPALFTANAAGTGQAAALNHDGSLNSPSNPANPGDLIVLYGTGEGLVSPAPADGTITQAPAPNPQLPVTVSIGGEPATVVYAAEAPGVVSGVIQINAFIPAGVQPSHHLPVSWSAGSYLSQPGVTIAVNDSPAPMFVYQAGVDDLSLTSISISPARIAADTGGTTLTVTGSGFVSGMVVQWNKQARATTFLDATRLQVTLSGTDLETPGLDSIAVWDAAQTHPITESVPLLVYVAVLNNGLIYDAARDKIYVAVDQKQAPQGPSIAVLNPESGRVESWHSLTGNPTILALSDDDLYLYVCLGSLIRRINLNTWTAELDILLTPYSAAAALSSMVVLPGENTSLAVSFADFEAVFDGGQMRTTTINNVAYGPGYLLGGPNGNTLYAADVNGNFYTLVLNSSGIQIGQTVPGLLGADGDSVYAGGLLYDGWGEVVNPTLASVVETFDSSGLIVPLPDLQQILILGGTSPPGYSLPTLPPVLSLHDTQTGRRLWSLPLPVSLGGNHGPMLRCGLNCIALREFQQLLAPAPGVDLFRLNLGAVAVGNN
jgi:uncharacterized protein (TIGR03437 family)